MVTSGEEEVSFTEADERLRAWQRKRRFRNMGRLPELEQEIGELRGRLGELKKSVRELEGMEELAESCRQRRDSLQSQVEESRRTHRKSALERLSESRTAQSRLAAEAEKRRTAAGSLRGRLEACVFHGAEPEAIRDAVLADAREAGEAQRQALALPSPILWILFAVLGLLLLTLGVCYAVSIIPAGAALLTALWGRLHTSGERNAAQREALPAILSKYGVGAPDEIEPLLFSYSRDFAEYLRGRDLARRSGAREAAARQKELEGVYLQELDFEPETAKRPTSAKTGRDDRELEVCGDLRHGQGKTGFPWATPWCWRHSSGAGDEYEEQCRAYDALELPSTYCGKQMPTAEPLLPPAGAPDSRTDGLSDAGAYDLTLYKELDAMVRRAGTPYRARRPS
jgi:hypothetical protein